MGSSQSCSAWCRKSLLLCPEFEADGSFARSEKICTGCRLSCKRQQGKSFHVDAQRRGGAEHGRPGANEGHAPRQDRQVSSSSSGAALRVRADRRAELPKGP
eukprot:767157-Hanusia_phi.AAC.5